MDFVWYRCNVYVFTYVYNLVSQCLFYCTNDFNVTFYVLYRYYTDKLSLFIQFKKRSEIKSKIYPLLNYFINILNTVLYFFIIYRCQSTQSAQVATKRTSHTMKLCSQMVSSCNIQLIQKQKEIGKCCYVYIFKYKHVFCDISRSILN